MGAYTLTRTRIAEGAWEAELTGSAGSPSLEITHLGRPVEGLETRPAGPGRWSLRLPIPVHLVSEGVQTFVVREAGGDAVLDSFAIVAGEPLAGDLRAEIDLLRAELDLLKRAFRRHCAETDRGDGPAGPIEGAG